MLKLIGIVLVLAIVAILVLAAMKPDAFLLERSTTVNAPPDKVYPLIEDFKSWAKWSPWDAKDPAMKRTYSANTAGKGSTYGWEGNRDVGKGSMEITDASPPSRVAIKLAFVQPFEATNRVEFLLEPQGPGTKVTWRMQGESPFMAKVFQVFKSMDAMVGPDFETGLANLKKAAES